MIHIAPLSACQGLISNGAQAIRESGFLIFYGPFLQKNVPTAPSNVAFDQHLKTLDAKFGIRSLEEVSELTSKAGFDLVEKINMPASNLIAIFMKTRES